QSAVSKLTEQERPCISEHEVLRAQWRASPIRGWIAHRGKTLPQAPDHKPPALDIPHGCARESATSRCKGRSSRHQAKRERLLELAAPTQPCKANRCRLQNKAVPRNFQLRASLQWKGMPSNGTLIPNMAPQWNSGIFQLMPPYGCMHLHLRNSKIGM